MDKKTRAKSKMLPILLVLLVLAVILIVVITSTITNKQKEKKQEQINQAEQEAIDNLTKPINQTSEKQNTTSSNSSDKKVTYQGFETIGSIEIKSINLKYPILNDSSQKALEKSVCLMYGILNNGNAVIIGNNFNNGLFFSNLKKVVKNDEISITDTTGSKTQYIVYDKFETSKDDTSFYDRDTKGKNEITLVTVADNGTDRLVVVAKEK